jgi:hypothetical protein
MHVHPPKPLHGWREFFGEVGIIVLGILIALGGEQAVEALHWRHVVGETRESLGHTVEDAYAAMLSRQEMQACVDHKLAEIGIILDRHASGGPLDIDGPIGSPTASTAQTFAFDMAIASQAFSHMTMADQTRFFEPIGSYRTFDEVVKDERSAWQVLGAIDHAKSLTPADWSEVRKAYDKAQNINNTLSVDLKGSEPGLWLYSFRGFPKPKPADYSLRSIPRVQQLCRPSITMRGNPD